jgi:hypothetical protein
MYYTPAPPGSRLYLDFTRDQFCGKVLDRSGMCGEPAILQGNPIWMPKGLQSTFSGGNCIIKNNPHIDIVSASPQKNVIWWGLQNGTNNTPVWLMRKIHSSIVVSQYGFMVDVSSEDYKFAMYIYKQSTSEKISFSTIDYTKDFLWSVSWDGSIFTAYIDMEEIGSYAYDGNLTSTGGDLVIGGRSADGYGRGNVAMCGITVGASVSELHEWYRKYRKTGNHTSIVAMQSGTLPDSALDSTIMLKR